jgi:hypothetical protein
MIDKWIDQASADELRAALHRITQLITRPEHDAPEGAIVIIGSEGGHPKQPYRERAYHRDDAGRYSPIDPTTTGGRPGATYAWEEIVMLDDPACDRPDVFLDGYYIHSTDIMAALEGSAPTLTRPERNPQ